MQLSSWDRSTTWSQFRSTRRQRGWWLDGVRRDRRVHPHRSARCKMRGVVPDPRCGVAKFAADGPGRLSTSVSRACWTGHRQVARRGPPRATTGWPDRQDEAPQAELLADSGSEPGATRARSSSNRPLEQPDALAGLSQGWAGLPFHSRPMQLTSQRAPGPGVDAPRLVTRWASRDCCVCSHSSFLVAEPPHVVPQPIEQGPGHNVVPVRDGRPFA